MIKNLSLKVPPQLIAAKKIHRKFLKFYKIARVNPDLISCENVWGKVLLLRASCCIAQLCDQFGSSPQYLYEFFFSTGTDP